MKTLIIATHNQHKFNEISEKLKNFHVNCLSLNDIGWTQEIKEDGNTFLENALHKAKTVSDKHHSIVLADDSGLIVDALPGLLGVKSKRFSPSATKDDNNQLLLQMLDGLPNRNARFVSQMVLYYPDGLYYSYQGVVEGSIAFDCKGSNGFGYDPLFIVKDKQCRMAELSESEKNRISHRGLALERFIEDLKNESIVI